MFQLIKKPPIALIPRVLRQVEVCRAKGTLIVPLWPSAIYWPIICPEGENFGRFIEDWYDLPLSETLFLPGKSGSLLFKGKIPNTRVLALRLNYQSL